MEGGGPSKNGELGFGRPYCSAGSAPWGEGPASELRGRCVVLRRVAPSSGTSAQRDSPLLLPVHHGLAGACSLLRTPGPGLPVPLFGCRFCSSRGKSGIALWLSPPTQEVTSLPFAHAPCSKTSRRPHLTPEGRGCDFSLSLKGEDWKHGFHLRSRISM